MKSRIAALAAITIILSGVAAAENADEIVNWNRTMMQAAQTAGTPPFEMSRTAAIVQAAVYDAVNGIERRYTPIHVHPEADSGASQRAAAVMAAYTTLNALYPAQKALFDQQFASSLASIASDAAAQHSVSIIRGLRWGYRVATAILDWRKTDGYSDTVPPFAGGSAPGEWRPTPPAFKFAAAPQMATMTPWMIQAPAQFRPVGPPALTSGQYTADFNEIKELGRFDSTSRTPEQTLLAQFWQSTTPSYLFDTAALALAAERHMSLSDRARLLAILNVAIADAYIACWDAKYHYAFWRPVTAIRFADTDDNPATVADGAWAPLLVTPNMPDYPSGHTTIAGAAAAVLASIFGEQSNIAITSDAAAMSGVVRSFTSFTGMIQEVVEARVLGGIHFRTADVIGQEMGVAVGRYVTEHGFQSRRTDEH